MPSKDEIECCSQWLNAEVELLKPELLIPVGKLAIAQYTPCNKLIEVISKCHKHELSGGIIDVVNLPHLLGASAWHRMEPGKTLLQDTLNKIKNHLF